MPFLNSSETANIFSYVKNFIIKSSYLDNLYRRMNISLFEEEHYFFHQAVQDVEFQQIDHWRRNLPKETRSLNQLIVRKTPPRVLRDQFLARLEQFEQTISSPIYYHLYLQKLENKIVEKTPWQYGYVLQEARARLREKIKANPDRAVTYLHNDMSYQLARLSGGQIPLKLFEQTVAYYKRLVPEVYYNAMKKMLDGFVMRYDTNKSANEIYSELQNQLNGLVQSYFEHSEEEIEQTSVTFSWSAVMKGFMDLACHPQWVLLGMGMLVGQGIQLVKSYPPANGLVALDLKGLLPNLSPLVLGGVMHHWYRESTNTPVSSLHNAMPLAINMLTLLKFAKAESADTFLTTFGWTNGDTEVLYNIAPTSDGGSIVIGSTRTAYDMFLLKFDVNGNIEWDKIIESEYYIRGFVQQLTNGNYITAISVSSSISVEGNKDILLIVWNPTGNIIWGQKIVGSLDDEIFSVIATQDNAVVATGYMQNSAGENTFLGKWSAINGEQIWLGAFDCGSQRGIYVQQKIDGHYLVVGYGLANGGFGGEDIFLSEWDVNGKVVWVKALGTAENDYGRFIIQESLANELVISGFMGDKNNPIGLDSVLIQLDQNYSINWANRLSAPNNFVNVQQTSTGNYFTPGTFFDTVAGYFKPMLAQWALNGTLLASQILNWSLQNNSTYVFSQLANDGNLFVLGNSNITGTKNSVLAKFNSNGHLDDCAETQQIILSNITNISLQLLELSANFYVPSLASEQWLISPLGAETAYSRECPTSNSKPFPWLEIIVMPAALGAFLTAVIGCYIYKKRKETDQGYHSINQSRDVEATADNDLDDNDNSEKKVTIPRIPIDQLERKRELGKGICQVYEGLVPSYGRVAVKDLTSSLTPSQRKSYKISIEREVNLLANVRHENIIQLYGVCIGRQQEYYMIMQLMPKGSLATYLYDKEYRKRIISQERRDKIALGIIHGLFYLHTRKGENEQIQPIIHADLKPGNILLDDMYTPKLCDFGFSRVYGYNQQNPDKNNNRRSLQYAIGTLGYRDPTLSAENSECTTQTDIYSYGVVLNELTWVSEIGDKEDLYNKAVKLKETPPKCPASKAQLIASCWAERSQRPAAEEIYDKLLELRPHSVNPNIKKLPENVNFIKPDIKGLAYELVTGEGNCLLRAVAMFLGKDEAQLRKEAVEYLQLHHEEFGESLSDTQAVTRYINNLVDSVDLPSHFAMDLLMKMLQRPIIVIESITSKGLFMNPQDAQRFGGEPIFISYVDGNGSSHYDAFLLEQGANGREILETLNISSVKNYANYLAGNNNNNMFK